MYGANSKQVLACVERKTRITRLGFIPDIKSKAVNKKTEKLLKSFKVLSITNDNDPSFRKKMDWTVPVYFCDPMKPQQRGTVENTIGQLRRYIKRDTDLSELGEAGLKRIEHIINNTPRKMFGYRTPFEMYYKKKVALVLQI